MSEIKGIEELEARLERMAGADLVKGVVDATLLVQGAAKANVQVDNGELRGSIYTDVRVLNGEQVTGRVYTNKKYAPFVEFGTGPKGQASHEGISPNVPVAYTQSPWWIHEGPGENEVDRATAEKYHWTYVDTPQGRFYRCSGHPAYPFLYPAIKDNEEAVIRIIAEEVRKQL